MASQRREEDKEIGEKSAKSAKIFRHVFEYLCTKSRVCLILCNILIEISFVGSSDIGFFHSGQCIC